MCGEEVDRRGVGVGGWGRGRATGRVEEVSIASEKSVVLPNPLKTENLVTYGQHSYSGQWPELGGSV